MKKIMFNDRYGLTDAVLSGRKIMTRHIVPSGTLRIAKMEVDIHGGDLLEYIKDHSFYMWSDEVAVAQSYQTLIEQGYLADDRKDGWVNEKYITSPGYSNKMFVRAKYMPHRIRITDIKVERLQDISEEDCLREGIMKTDCVAPYGFPVGNGKRKNYRTPQDAFACLIDKVSGTGTWNTNPLVFVYEFELIK